jgi:hypothetical protein
VLDDAQMGLDLEAAGAELADDESIDIGGEENMDENLIDEDEE